MQQWVQQCLSVRVSGTYSYHCVKHNERTHGSMIGQVFYFVTSDQVCRLWSTQPRLLNVILGTGGCGWSNTAATCHWCHVGLRNWHETVEQTGRKLTGAEGMRWCSWELQCEHSLLRGNIMNLQQSTAQWSLYVRPGLTFNSSTFCQNSMFMCFVWIWEQTAIIPLYSITWLVFITEIQCV